MIVRTLVLQLQSGTASVTARICDYHVPGGYCTADTATFSYTPPPPPPQKATPVVSIDHHNDDNVTSGMFEIKLAYTTSAYVSLDASRSITLVYSTSAEVAEATVQVDVSDNSQTPPPQMSIKLRRAGAYQTLLGLPPATQEQFYVGGNGTTRMAARVSTASLGLGASEDTVVVASIWTDGTRLETIAPARVLVARDVTSPYGRGWWIAGLQRLTVTSGGVTISSGGGAIAYFKNCPTACGTYISPRGDFTVLNQLGSGWKRRWPDGTEAFFDSQGRDTALVDRYGNRIRFGYDGTSPRLTGITDPVGLVTSLFYDGSGKLDRIQDPMGRVTQVTVDASGDLTEIFDPDGVRALRVTYANHVPVFTEPRTGGRMDFVRDAVGRFAAESLQAITVDGQSVRPTIRYKAIESQVLPLGDGMGTSGQPLPRKESATLRAVMFAPNGDSTVYALNRFGQPTRVEFQNPQGKWRTATWSYNIDGLVTRSITAEGDGTEYTWAGPDMLQEKNVNTGITTDILWNVNPYHQPRTISVTRPGVTPAVLREHFFGPLGRLDSTKVGTSKTAFTYDTRGRVLTVTDPGGHQTTIGYHPGGTQNTHLVTAPRGNGAPGTITRLYDAYGRDTSVTDAAGRVYKAGFDALNRVMSTTGPLGTRTILGYNDAMRTYTLTDPKSQVYTTIHNALGWLEQRVDSRGGIERHEYDRHGNVVRYTNRRNQVAVFTYDGRNRPLTTTADGQTTTWSYDSLQTWVAVANAEGSDTVKLDADGRLDREIAVRGGGMYTMRTFYRSDGRRNRVQLSGPWGTRETAFGYDALLRLDSLWNSLGQATRIAYDKEHRDSLVRFPIALGGGNQFAATLSYTPADLLQRLVVNSVHEPSLGRRYTYDQLDRISTMARGQLTDLDAATYRDEVVRTVSYDSLGRLVAYDDTRHWEEQGNLVCPDPFDLTTCYYEINQYSQLLRQDGFQYDSVGNRRDHGGVIENGNRQVGFDGYTLTYDADGNLLTKVKAGVINQSFVWSTLGHLTQVTTNGVVTTFGYDGFGRRVRKTHNGSTTRYLYDGHNLVAELDDGGNLIREYAYYPGIDRPHSVRRMSDNAVFYYQAEIPGHVTGLVSATNQLVNKYEYTPWGEAITAVEGVVQPFRYTAREWDSETGLYYYRARYYDPRLGRFISEDPIGLAGGLNAYAYVNNRPTTSRDPWGLDDEEDPCPTGYELIDSWDIVLSGGESATANKCVGPGGNVLVVYTNIATVLTPITVTAAAVNRPRIVRNLIIGFSQNLPLTTILYSTAAAEATCRLNAPGDFFVGIGGDWFPAGYGRTAAGGAFFNSTGIYGYARAGGGLGWGDVNPFVEFGFSRSMPGTAVEFGASAGTLSAAATFNLEGELLSVNPALGPPAAGLHVAITHTTTALLAAC